MMITGAEARRARRSRCNRLVHGERHVVEARASCFWTSFAYAGHEARRSLCDPESATAPWSTMKMTSASITVDSLCAIWSDVRSRMIRRMASETSCSAAASKADVASSRSSTRGSARSARATATRCFCPPESMTPLSPTSVSYLSGKRSMKSEQLAALAHASIIEASG
mmetsp:Transcript_26471/g.91348  ORF Transcript_26471/g.91348 Transcript_26471/m.91348 type:complete len:168 (-) Transcript_26471:983-1486(-)